MKERGEGFESVFFFLTRRAARGKSWAKKKETGDKKEER